MLLSWTLPMERVFDEWVANEKSDRDPVIRPAVDVTDDGDVFRIVVEMPGVAKDGLSIDLENDELRVRGSRPALAESEKVLVNGRDSNRPFERSFTLGKDVDREQVKARLENGLLTLTLPRKAAVKPKRIEVEVTS